jgi:hypothetical protein
VTFIEAMPNIMPGFDKEIARMAQRLLINGRPIDYHTNVLATKVTPGVPGEAPANPPCTGAPGLAALLHQACCRWPPVAASLDGTHMPSAASIPPQRSPAGNPSCQPTHPNPPPPAAGVKPVLIELTDFKTKEMVDTLEVDAVLVATGRAPFTQVRAPRRPSVDQGRGKGGGRGGRGGGERGPPPPPPLRRRYAQTPRPAACRPASSQRPAAPGSAQGADQSSPGGGAQAAPQGGNPDRHTHTLACRASTWAPSVPRPTGAASCRSARRWRCWTPRAARCRTSTASATQMASSCSRTPPRLRCAVAAAAGRLPAAGLQVAAAVADCSRPQPGWAAGQWRQLAAGQR